MATHRRSGEIETERALPSKRFIQRKRGAIACSEAPRVQEEVAGPAHFLIISIYVAIPEWSFRA